MEFEKAKNLIFSAVPEFESSYDDELNEGYFNSFLGGFGLFTRDAIVERKPYAIKSLEFINKTFNEFYEDKDFTNKMIVNILEILTDYYITQKVTVENFNGRCLTTFKEILNSFFFTNLLEKEKNTGSS